MSLLRHKNLTIIALAVVAETEEVGLEATMTARGNVTWQAIDLTRLGRSTRSTTCTMTTIDSDHGGARARRQLLT